MFVSKRKYRELEQTLVRVERQLGNQIHDNKKARNVAREAQACLTIVSNMESVRTRLTRQNNAALARRIRAAQDASAK